MPGARAGVNNARRRGELAPPFAATSPLRSREARSGSGGLAMNARPAFSKEAAQACLSACYEYLLITLPVALYVVLEAIHKGDATFCLWSPEWAIATIFLAF